MIEPSALVPFIPGGKDFEQSRRLLRALGCTELWSNDGYVVFRWGSGRFILQDLDLPAFTGNLMIRVDVSDLDTWWEDVSRKELEAGFPGFRINPPRQFPWGREVHFIDLAGVCWHVGVA